MNPVVRWRTPSSGGWCGPSTDARGTITWCGTGWTGQPNVLPRKDGRIEVRIGAYDHNYHFLNGRTGQDFRPQLETGDLAKGSATSDADGYPLYYGGSRDNLLRVVAMDRPEPTVLWSVDSESSVPNPVWNSDWDGAPLQVGDYLLEGGENSWFYVIRLHRGYDANHKVTVDPQVVFTVPGFDDQLFADLGDNEVSIENSVAFRDGIAYFGNSGGLIQGWDIRNVLQGGSDARRVFRFWVGDNTDATIVIDQEGDLYVARHKSHNITSRVNPKAATLGSLMKLDPRQANDPVVWSVHAGNDDLLGTPALYRGVVYAESTDGTLIAVNAESGKVVWRFWGLTGPMENSPVPIDGKLLFGDCAGVLHLWDIADPKAKPKKVWELNLGGCIESTPAVWHGWIWVGTRAGAFYGISDAA